MRAQLSQLVLSNVRNLGSVDLSFNSKFNIFIGKNGSGKTSLLEAIHLLGVGRSFRARSMQQVIKFGAEYCLIRANIRPNHDQQATDIWVGVKKDVNGGSEYRAGEQIASSAAELSKLLPLQLIDVNSSELLVGGPKNRRQFVDWGVFHVEHSFLESWRAMQRALEQRNAALKQKRLASEWDTTFIRYAQLVDNSRKAYIQAFEACFVATLQEMLDYQNVTVNYLQGWNSEAELAVALERTSRIDNALGFTNCGPHRADLEILIDGRPAKAVLSRGQTKIFVCAMLLARAKLLQHSRDSIFLIDDLHAELDQDSCNLLITALQKLNVQVFITGIEPDALLQRLEGCDLQMFHVEHGGIRQAVMEELAE